MRYYYDLEFHERRIQGHPVFEPLSIGVSCDDGREFYAVNMDADWEAANADPWLKANVLPYLGGAEHYKRLADIRAALLDFLRPTHEGDPTELWGWYSAHDHVILTSILGSMTELPDYVPQWTNDVRQHAHRHNDPVLPPQVSTKHNALEDARHAMFLHRFLEALAK